MTLVVDASVVVAALLDEDQVGEWAAGMLRTDLLAPDHLLLEVTSAIRRAVLSGRLTDTLGTVMVDKAWDMPFTGVGFAAVAARVWELRRTVATADAAYVAVAEMAGATLATADLRLARASGPRCGFLVPPPP